MQAGCSVGVVVPAYNEERQIGRVLETMPQFVDHIIVVDDRSSDATLERCREWQDRLGRRLTVIEQPKNLGVGAAITSGYRRAVDIGLDVVAVMAGDGQMDPNDLTLIIDVDVETGKVTLERFAVGHDCGVVINPVFVEGQMEGAVAMGVGAALTEEQRYDDEGNFLSQSIDGSCFRPLTSIASIQAMDIPTTSSSSSTSAASGSPTCRCTRAMESVSDLR